MSKTKILIDCDPGHDDLVAILYAAKHLDLVGVTTVHGNNTLANTTRNGLIALELGNLQVPLATGCAEPLVQNSIGIGAGHGKSGLDGHDFVDPKINPIDMHAVEFIIELSRKYKEELIIATIGPETNIAMAIKKEPRLKKWIREISIMGGSTTMGNISPVAEFNIAADVEAAAAVFESGIPFRMARRSPDGLQQAAARLSLVTELTRPAQTSLQLKSPLLVESASLAKPTLIVYALQKVLSDLQLRA